MRARWIGLVVLACPWTARAGVVINEVLPDPVGADAGFEWVEIVNTDAAAVDLTGWEIEAGTASYGSKFVFPAWILQPGERVLVGEASVVGADLVATLGLGNAGASCDALRLVDATGLVIDTVVYGPVNTDGWLDDTGAVATSFPSAPSSGSSIARLPDGVDTQQCGVDFQEQATPTPDATNDVAAPVDTGPPLDTGAVAPACDPASGVVLNEVVSDPAGADTNLEWVELYNPGGSPVDVSGWTVSSGTTSFSGTGTLPAGAIVPAGGYLVVGQSAIPEVDVVAAGFTLGNASTSSDGVQLATCDGAVVDTVIYGSPNTDGWIDDTGSVAVSLAPAAASGGSIGRSPNGADTNASGVDFVGFAAPTPRAENATSGGGGGGSGDCDLAAAAVGVVINELLSDPDGSDTGLEWVEIVNGSAASVDVSGWVVAAGTSSFSGGGTLPAGTVIPAGGFLVVGQTAIAEADVVAAGFSLGNASSSSDGVRLEDCAGAVVDTVIYGDPNTDGWIDDSGAVATSLAPVATGGASTGRLADGVDTDASGLDFGVFAFASPGVSNTAPAEDCGAVGSGLTINEFVYDPDGSDTGLEWVELFHAGTAPVDLSGWSIQKATSSFSTAFTFPDGVVVQPGDRLLVGESLVPGIDFEASLGMGNASSSADGVRLVDCAGFPADTVIYGDDNPDGLLDDSGQPAVSLAPSAGSGESLQRVSDGYDTDASAVDFAAQAAPTPGSPNPEITPVVCVPSTGDVVLNEFVPNPDGDDAAAEWIELYNGGAAPVDLSGWGIDVATSAWGDPDVVLPGGTVLAPGDWLVVGGSLAPEVDVVGDFSLGNASSNADGIRLLDCAGTVVDTVLYGQSNPDGLVDDAGGIVPSAVPGEAGSLARDTDGLDTDAAEDWVPRGAPSPGASNVFDPGTGGGTDKDGPGGCGGGRPGASDRPGGGCTTTPLPFRGAAALAALALVVRRRRPGVC